MSEPAAEFIAGDCVLTPGGNRGTIQPAPWSMPMYELVAIDTGATIWIRSELLKPADSEADSDAMPAPKRKRRSHR